MSQNEEKSLMSTIDLGAFRVVGDATAFRHVESYPTIRVWIEKFLADGPQQSVRLADLMDMEGSGGGYYFIHHVNRATRTVTSTPYDRAYQLVEAATESRNAVIEAAARDLLTHVTWTDENDEPCIWNIFKLSRSV